VIRTRFLALAATASLIAGYEGLQLTAYSDPVGIPTACFGMTRAVEHGRHYTVAECEEFLFEVAVAFQRQVRRHISAPMTPGQLAAYTSFTYNIGEQAFSRSTLVRKHNAGDTRGACDELLRWRYATVAGAKVELPGLVARREAEREVCINGIEAVGG